MSLQEGYKNWLSLGFLKSKAVMARLDQASLNDFNPSEKALKVVFKIGKEWFEAHKNIVPIEHIYHLLEVDIQPNNVLNEFELQEFLLLIEYVYIEYTSPIELAESYIQDIFSSFLEDRQVRPLLQELPNAVNISQAVEQIRSAVRRTGVVKTEPIDPFAAEIPLANGEKKTRWCCDFLDSITGGATRGETTLLLAPSGGGKTLSNIQIACSAALAGEDAVIFSYEQAVNPGLTNRIYSYILHLPNTSLHGLSHKEWTDLLESDKALKELWEIKRAKLQGKLHMFDMLDLFKRGGACGGVEDIATCIKRLQDTGKAPRYVGLDWFGPFIDNYMASGRFSNKRSNAPKHEIMTAAANELRILGSDLGVNLFIYHQLGTQAAKGKPIDLPQAIDAHECRTLHHYMDTVICIGRRTENNNLAYVHVPKQRNGTADLKACIQMDGAYSRWKYISDRVVDDGNGGLMIPGKFDDNDDVQITAKAEKVKQAYSSMSALGYIS